MNTKNGSKNVKVSVYIATSLDGFIARPDGGLDWLPGAGDTSEGGSGDAAPGEDYGFEAFINSVDALLMGRNTYEILRGFGGDWPYGDTPAYVLSHTLRKEDIPDKHKNLVQLTKGQPAELLEELAQAGVKHIYLDGGKTIQDFLRAGLVDEMTVTRVPVLIGNGIPLFGEVNEDIKLKHLETNSFSSGITMSKYRVLK